MTDDHDALKTTFSLSVKQARDIAILVGHAIGHAIGRNKTRYYLNGVYLHNTAEGFKAVGTDEIRVAIYNITHTDVVESLPTVEFGRIIPEEAVIWLSKLHKKSKHPVIFTIEGMKLTIVHENFSVSYVCIDGVFPDYMRVIPALPAATVKLNARLLGDMAKALESTGNSAAVTLHVDGLSPVHVTTDGSEKLTYVMMSYHY